MFLVLLLFTYKLTFSRVWMVPHLSLEGRCQMEWRGVACFSCGTLCKCVLLLDVCGQSTILSFSGPAISDLWPVDNMHSCGEHTYRRHNPCLLKLISHHTHENTIGLVWDHSFFFFNLNQKRTVCILVNFPKAIHFRCWKYRSFKVFSTLHCIFFIF